MFDFVKNLGKRKLITLAIFAIILVALPIILIQVQNQQNLKQRAAESDTAYFVIANTLKIKPGDSFLGTNFGLINPLEKDISAIDVIISYDNNILVLDSFKPTNGAESDFTTIINDTSVPGKIHYVGVNSNSSHHNQKFFSVGYIYFTGKAQGAGNVQLFSAIVTAQGEAEPLAINPTYNKLGNFTIAEPTPTPFSVPVSATIGNCGNEFCGTGFHCVTNNAEPAFCEKDLTPISQSYYLEKSQQVIYMPVSQPNTGYGINVVLKKSGSNNTVINQQDFVYYWRLDDHSMASISVNALCIYDIQPPCPEGNVLIKGLNPGSGNIAVSVVKNSTGLPVATAVFSLNVLPSGIPTPTPDLTPAPFTSSVFPSKGLAGTLFTISAKTKTGQKVEFTIHGPGVNSKVDVSDDGYGDGIPNDGNYAYIFNSQGMPIGTYSITFAIDGKQLDTFNVFEVEDLKIADKTCIPITKNGDSSKKIDIVVMPNGYKESELYNFQKEILNNHIDYLFSKDPFSFNKDKFNIWFLDVAIDTNCSYENSSFCTNKVEEIITQTCTFADKIILLDKQGAGGYASGFGTKTAVTRGSSDPESLGTTLHEFGHSMGNLADEYETHRGLSNTSLVNCDDFACPKWCSGTSSFKKPLCSSFKTQGECITKKYNGVGCIWFDEQKCDYPYFSNVNFGQSCSQNSVCLYGCGGPDGYRSSNQSVMGDVQGISTQNKEYNAVSKIQIQREIGSFGKPTNITIGDLSLIPNSPKINQPFAIVFKVENSGSFGRLFASISIYDKDKKFVTDFYKKINAVNYLETQTIRLDLDLDDRKTNLFVSGIYTIVVNFDVNNEFHKITKVLEFEVK